MSLARALASVVIPLALAACSPANAPADASDAAAHDDLGADHAEATLDDVRFDAIADATDFDEGPLGDVRVPPPGLGVVLRPDGRLDIGVDGVAFDGTEFVLRFGDGSERALSSLTIEPAVDASMALEARDGDALWVRVSLAMDPSGAVSLDWQVRSAREVQGIEVRTPRTTLPDEARPLFEGSQSWSFAGALRLEPGAMLARDASGAITYPAAPGEVLGDARGVGWFRGDVVWRAGGLSVCATAPYDRALIVSLERPTLRYVLRITDGIFADERTTPSTDPLHGRIVLAHADPTSPFACHVAAPPPARTRGDRPFPRGWWSWNTLFEHVTGTQVDAQLDPLAAIDPSAHHITVDDGWETAWGNWTERPEFGTTLGALASQLQTRGASLGLWLAPFLVDPAAPLVAMHPDWFVHDRSGALARVSIALGRDYDILDATHPEVLAYLTSLFAQLRTAGVRLFKIDFLYAAAHPGVRHDPLVNGLVAYRRGLEAIAAGAGDAHINGCGALVLPSLAFVDSIRIASDNTFANVAPFWGSVAGTARNLAVRHGLEAFGVVPDPDQPVVRGFSDDEARSFLAVGLLSGSAFGYGDDLSALTASQGALLGEAWLVAWREARATAVPLDLFDAVGDAFVQTPVVEAFGGARATTRSVPPSVWRSDGASMRRDVLLFNWTTTAADRRASESLFVKAPSEIVANASVRHEPGAYVVAVPPHAVRVLSGTRP